MNKFVLISVLVLALAWGYTSWYWYVCNIKGLCNTNYVAEVISEDTIFSEVPINNSSPSNEDMLTLDDVVGPEVTSDIVEQDIQGKNREVEEVEIITEDTETDSEFEVKEETPQEETKDVSEDTKPRNINSICQNPIVGPIALGGENNTDEVERLEAFLISRGEDIEINGSYGQEDFEAIKRFQLEYKADILDPWDITSPTGYVFRTTVKKINEVACQ